MKGPCFNFHFISVLCVICPASMKASRSLWDHPCTKKKAEHMGIGRIIIATDSMNLNNALTSTSYDQAKLGHLFLEIKYRLIMEFHDYVIEYCPRPCNKPAHCLAAMGMRESQTDQLLWLSDFPNDVSCLVTDDLVVS